MHDLSFALMFEMENLPPDILEKAASGEVVILTNDSENRVRALIKLNNFIENQKKTDS